MHSSVRLARVSLPWLPRKTGFFCDVDIPADPNANKNATISINDFPILTEIAMKFIQEKHPVEFLSVPREVALQIFAYNPFIQEIIHDLPKKEERISLYKCGNFVSLSRGPHLTNISLLSFFLERVSGVYWRGKAENPHLQRVYGISFPDEEKMEEWKKAQKDDQKVDHRKIGQDQALFFFHPYSPGCSFMLPHGTRIYNRLLSFMKDEYHKRGYTEVITPNMFNKALWETSGHWQHYQENMFVFDCDATQFSLKPMNCPGHCLMFAHAARSYRELTLRFADFGVLHRNELAGALTGLTRVRRFQEDDAHIFCAPEMVGQEIANILEFVQYVYGIFGIEFAVELSTRPQSGSDEKPLFLGDKETWDKAEKIMEDVLNAFGKPWKCNPGGAFYGPKIDIFISDAQKRLYQCATIQLDFQLPKKFQLKYVDQNGKEVEPVIIHRAIFGSVERFMALLCERTGGKWPFWLSPRQCIVISISEKHNDYALQVYQAIHDAGYYVDHDLSDKPLRVKIAHHLYYNYMLIIGDKEVSAQCVSVRARSAKSAQMSVAEVLAEFAQLTSEYK